MKTAYHKERNNNLLYINLNRDESLGTEQKIKEKGANCSKTKNNDVPLIQAY